MKFNKKILLSMALILGEARVYSSGQPYNFAIGEVEIENGAGPLCQNPRYVDRALLIIDQNHFQVMAQFKARSIDIHPKDMVIFNSLFYGVALPMYRCNDFYQYPSYQTFSRVMTDPAIMLMTATIGFCCYFVTQKSHEKEIEEVSKDVNL